MKNREKYAEQILDIACKGLTIAMDLNGNLVPCCLIDCNNCYFDNNCNCREGIAKWCEAEYVEKPTLTSKEKSFLDLLKEEYKYITRDRNGLLLVYTEKPIKISGCWGLSCYALANMLNIKFDFIKSEDEEPWLIEDLKKLEVRNNG